MGFTHLGCKFTLKSFNTVLQLYTNSYIYLQEQEKRSVRFYCNYQGENQQEKAGRVYLDGSGLASAGNCTISRIASLESEM
jgi:hypothetical protein